MQNKKDLENLISFGASVIFQAQNGTYEDLDIQFLLKRGEE